MYVQKEQKKAKDITADYVYVDKNYKMLKKKVNINNMSFQQIMFNKSQSILEINSATE